MGEYQPIRNQEIILKGDQTSAIRVMLDGRAFALLELPCKQAVRLCRSPFELAEGFAWVCVIRERASQTLYEDCCLALIISHNGEDTKYLQLACDNVRERGRFDDVKMTSPSVDELLTFLEDKKLVVNGGYTNCGGDMEGNCRKLFLEMYLNLWRAYHDRHLIYDEFLDIRIFLTGIEGFSAPVGGLTSADIRCFNIDPVLHELLHKQTEHYYCNSSHDYSVDFEAQSEVSQASYFLKCFHGIHDYNHGIHHDMAGVFCCRFSAFILPCMMESSEATAVPENKRAHNFETGADYVIDSIHINTEICSDIAELQDWLVYHLNSMEDDD